MYIVIYLALSHKLYNLVLYLLMEIVISLFQQVEPCSLLFCCNLPLQQQVMTHVYYQGSDFIA